MFRRVQDDSPISWRPFLWEGCQVPDGQSHRPDAGRSESAQSDLRVRPFTTI